MIFDTDVLIWASRGSEKAARAIDAAPDRALAIVSLMELLQGARSKLEVRQILQSLRQLQFRILPLSEAKCHTGQTADGTEVFSVSRIKGKTRIHRCGCDQSIG
jgi:predicted nucleic acid-binding protein